VNQLALTLTAPPVKVGSRVARYVWRVIAVDATGRGHGTCGHAHADAGFATMCPWEPAGWDQMPVCDLLVREVRQ
jgi:hypothetical protein